jgi:hypothetical protein
MIPISSIALMAQIAIVTDYKLLSLAAFVTAGANSAM